MTDAQASELAISCALAVVNNDLESVAFTHVLRRGLQKSLDKLNGDLVSPNHEDWQSLSLVEKCKFPGLEAFLFHVNAGDGLREVLVGLDEAHWVSDFAFAGAREPFVKSYLEFASTNPWFHVAGHSTRYKLDGLMPFESGVGLGGNRNHEDRVVFCVTVPVAPWEQLSVMERERILDELAPIALGYYWLSFNMLGAKRRVRIVIVKRCEEPGVIRSYGGDPPPEEVLADRFANIPSLLGG